jgi:hypothetical protein
MASFNASNYAKTVAVPKEFIDFGDVGGEVKCMYDSFSYTAAPAQNDLIYFGKLPKHARVLKVIAKASNGGGTGVIDVGTAAVVDAFVDGLDHSAAAAVKESTVEAGLFANRLAAETDVIAKIITAATAAAGKIEVIVLYSVA